LNVAKQWANKSDFDYEKDSGTGCALLKKPGKTSVGALEERRALDCSSPGPS